MGKPRFVYNGNTLDLPVYLRNFKDPPMQGDNRVDASNTGFVQVFSVKKESLLDLSFEKIDESFYDFNVVPFLCWLESGKEFSFLFDNAKNPTNTTISAVTAPSTIDVASTAGMAAGDVLYLRNQSMLHEYVSVLSVVNGTRITVNQTIKWTYAAGDVCRAKRYWPKLVMESKGFVPTYNNGLPSWSGSIKARESI